MANRNYNRISGVSMNFKILRKKIGTQEEVAKILNLDQTSIAKYENGKSYPRRKNLKKLAELFGISEGEVLKAIDNSKIDDLID